MDHKPLDKMSTNALIYEIAGSKQCLASHGIDSTIFGHPFNLGSNMPSVVDIVSKYLHDNGFKVLLLNQFGFDPTNNVFYLKNVPSSTSGTATNAATLLSGAPSYSTSSSK